MQLFNDVLFLSVIILWFLLVYLILRLHLIHKALQLIASSLDETAKTSSRKIENLHLRLRKG